MMSNGSPSSSGKRRRGRRPKVVKYHKAKRQHSATLRLDGRTEYFCADTEPEVLEKYNRRLAELQKASRAMSDDETESELLSAGDPAEAVEENPELRKIARRDVFVAVGPGEQARTEQRDGHRPPCSIHPSHVTQLLYATSSTRFVPQRRPRGPPRSSSPEMPR